MTVCGPQISRTTQAPVRAGAVAVVMGEVRLLLWTQ